MNKPSKGKLWIRKAIEKPGTYRKSIHRRYGKRGFTKKGTIKTEIIAKDVKKSGRLGKQARLARTLRKLRK